MEVKWNACCFKLRFGFVSNKLHFNGQFKVHLIPNKLQTLGKRKEGKQAGKLQRNSPQGCVVFFASWWRTKNRSKNLTKYFRLYLTLFSPPLLTPSGPDRYEYSCLVPDNRDADKKPKHARQLAVSPKKESDKTALFSFGLAIEGSVRF